MTHVPTPTQAVDALRPLLRKLVEALRRGTVHAQEYATWKDEDIDRALAPSHVRKGAKRFLLADGQDVHDDADDLDYETQALSNLGLLIKTGQVQIRLLRSATGHGLPVPGQSIARRQYYNQLSLFDSQSVGLAEGDPLVGRFVLHWSTDAEYNLERVYLALPKTGGETRDSVEAYWDWPIWRRHSLVSDGQVQAEVLDVDIYLDDEATGTGG